MQVKISHITKNELSELMLIDAKKEGWHYSKYDVDFYFKMSPIYAIRIDNVVVGSLIFYTTSTTVREQEISSVGFFLVKSNYRSLCLGTQLWSQIVEPKVKNNCLICLNSVPRLVDFYSKHGFSTNGVINKYFSLRKEDYFPGKIKASSLANVDIRRLSSDKLYFLEKFNQRIFSTNALHINTFLTAWAKRPDAIIMACYHDSGILGYGILTISQANILKPGECLSCRISPLYAVNFEIATKLLERLLKSAFAKACDAVELNMPMNCHTAFTEHLRRIGFSEHENGETVVMQSKYDNKNSLASLDNIFVLLPLEYPHESITVVRQ